MNIERNVVDGANFARVGGRTATKGRFGEVEDLSQVVDFNDRHRQSLLSSRPRPQETIISIKQSIPYSRIWNARHYPAIIGTAASAASMPIVRARLKCSLRKMRARITVTAG